MQTRPELAFAAERGDPPGLEIRVNFGVFAGREATPAELDDLGRALLTHVRDVSIVSEQRHEISGEAEAALHQVRIELDDDALPADSESRAELRGRLLEVTERWAAEYIADRHVDVA